MKGPIPEQVIVGEVVAGQAVKVRKQLENLISNIDKNTFDLSDLLYEVRSKKYYLPKYTTFAEYIKTLNFKPSKAYYLARIKEVMVECEVPREKYEPLGLSKLREITSLNPADEWNGSPMKDYIVGLIENSQERTYEQVKELVRTLKGQTGEDEIVWMNLPVKRIVRDKVVRAALELAKAKLGSSYRDADGNAVDPSDANALEIICVEFLNDPANSAELLQKPDEEGPSVGGGL